MLLGLFITAAFISAGDVYLAMVATTPGWRAFHAALAVFFGFLTLGIVIHDSIAITSNKLLTRATEILKVLEKKL